MYSRKKTNVLLFIRLVIRAYLDIYEKHCPHTSVSTYTLMMMYVRTPSFFLDKHFFNTTVGTKKYRKKANKDGAVRSFFQLENEGLGKTLEIGGTKGTTLVGAH